MSTSDLYRVYGTKATHIAEFRNGWGSAPVVWGYLCEKYLGGTRTSWGINTPLEKLWALSADERVPRCLRLTLGFTYDWAVCPPKKAGELADALEEAGKLCDRPGYVNHWQAIANELRNHKARARQVGIGISCTSVNDIWIDWKGKKKPWNVFAVLKQSSQRT